MLLFGSSLFAQEGEIYGNIKAKNFSMSTLKIELYNGNSFVKSAAPDKSGGYRLKKLVKGKYTLKVKSGSSLLGSIVIYSYQNPVRCNLVVEQVNNLYRIRRI